ncbi:universal stress protein [Tsukamurella tyrosinosolvens]|uniref:Nucleotide-binding universal stress protein, UspA family n=1 Tax=Tsukamurella tyrosinosolvens TaxID=57704 RepID=A0A1H4KY00_TSUTY|nr:universal stress protein [Tsukamurella tyrosinosolvens]KXO96441.1 universal stress protein UspA [Tsukamurella tyrosinosolvens]KXP01198.1 universal stress protein UspA [Tsukamurella tyrosinosolvens]KZL94579.1 universal stress protein UspA [Tsukamurella tyrosinosolvens]MCA4997378.1 universal stress protein [Tsukamurella tyrosinosolvens]WEL93403.1 universal stress protein [Tsukamurella tyrosinosolvens]
MKVYVAYLATDGGRDAVALGVQLARSLDAELALGMVVPPDQTGAFVSGDLVDQVLTDQAEGWLAQAREQVPADVETSTHIGVYDSIAEGIIAEAQRLDAAIVVVGATGGGLLGRHSLGPVVNDLIHSAPVAVALAPRGQRHSKAATVRSVTCAVGARPGAEELLDAAITGAERAGVPLRLVSLIAVDLMPTARQGDQAKLEEARRHSATVLDEARKRLSGTVDVSSVVVLGDTVEDAVNGLDWHPGDLIMVGSSRLAAPRRLFLGSTAAKMLRVLDVPMVVVPRAGLA